MEIINFKQLTPWNLVLNAARQTVGKSCLDKEPSNSWKARILLAEHSPIRLLQYMWTWKDIPYWVTNHLVRHHEGCEKFVVSQRDDRTNSNISRQDKKQGELISMSMTCNAQSLINISRKRLCNCASPETRNAWKLVKNKIQEVDPILADKMVRECVYRGFCPELKCCGFILSDKYDIERRNYLQTDY